MKDIIKKHKSKRNKLVISSMIILFIIAFCVLNNKWLTITEFTFTDKRIKNDFTIVQISDLHNASFGRDNSRLLNEIRRLEPDIIAITGDIVDASHTNIDIAVEFCNNIAELCPSYYVTGNHETWLEPDDKNTLYSGIKDSGVTILDDESVYINVNGNRIQMCGLDDDSLYNDALFKLAESFDRDLPVILLSHEPQYFDDYVKAAPDLVLTGHAHGGQMRLPFVGGLVAPDQGFFPKYTEGEFTEKNTHMIISRGLGNSVIPVRVFDPPEIVCIHVTGK